MADRICIVEGCFKKRHVAGGYCGMHHYRVKKYGHPEPALSRQPRRGLRCVLDGCDRPRYSGKYGWCQKHYQRWLTHGDPFKVLIEMGAGDNVTISAVHKRLEATRGRAREHQCVDCGGPARHWSYDHGDPNSRSCPVHGSYSTDLNRYQPRCVPCHKRFDLDRLGLRNRICSVEGCDRRHRAKGLCNKHWKAAHRKRHDSANPAGYNHAGQTRQRE